MKTKAHKYCLRYAAIAVALALCCAPFTALCVAAPDDDIAAAIDRDIPDSLFPPEFQDSLRNAWAIEPAPALRRLDSLPPFARGERIVYEVSWEFIAAGRATLTLAPQSNTGHLRCMAKAASNAFISTFFRLRDGMVSTMDAAGLYPVFSAQHLREGKYRADRWYLFDQRAHVVYSNEKVQKAPCAPFTQDFLSVLYYVRSRTLAVGDTFTIPLYAHPQTHQVFFKVTERKQIRCPANSFMCLCLVPQLTGKGRVFRARDEIKLWLSDDSLHIPVLATSKLKFGSLIMTMTEYQPARP
jgi:hypothetical protein